MYVINEETKHVQIHNGILLCCENHEIMKIIGKEISQKKLNCEVIQAQSSHTGVPASHFCFVFCLNLEHNWKPGNYKGAFGRSAD